jgi:hypothetical protein
VYSEEPSAELAMYGGRRADRVEFWRERIGVLVCVWYWAGSLASSASFLRWLRLELRDAPPGETSPSCANCCCANAKSAGCCEVRRAMSELPRVMSVIGGPWEVSMPCPLNEAGGLRGLGERASLAEAACCGEKYEGEVAALDDGGTEMCCARAGVEGFDAPRERADATELADGRRRSVGVVGVVGSVWVRWCCAGSGCASSSNGCPDGLREYEAGIALALDASRRCREGPGYRYRTCSEQKPSIASRPRSLFHEDIACRLASPAPAEGWVSGPAFGGLVAHAVQKARTARQRTRHHTLECRHHVLQYCGYTVTCRGYCLQD